MRNQKAEQEAKDRAQSAQRIVDKKKVRIHGFLVAAFGSAFTLLLEHFDDIVHFIQIFFYVAHLDFSPLSDYLLQRGVRMFSNLQLKILNLLHKNGQMSKADILNHFRLSKGLDVNALLKNFEASGYVRCSSDNYSLTNSGRVVRTSLLFSDIRYWVTTGIAVAAALKAYLL